MAEHRGFKLLRSRKRTPGVGDFGKFGLIDAKGEAVLGVGADGLTATPGDVEQYLRGGGANSWKLSAEREPDRSALPVKKRAGVRTQDDDPPVRRGGRAAPRVRASPTPPRPRHDPPPRATPVLRIVKSEVIAEPALRIRPGKASDATALRILLMQLAAPASGDIEANFEKMKKSRAGLFLAEMDGPVGCCAWAVLPTLQHGLVGRLTLLLVDKDYRRRGIATALLEAAGDALAKAGCESVEVMSDIRIDNAHNFFRALQFEQRSYRFFRPIGSIRRAGSG